MPVTAQSKPSLLVVQPIEGIQAADGIAAHFVRLLPDYLGEPAVLHAPSHAKEVEGVHWSIDTAPQQRTVVLLSALLLEKAQKTQPDEPLVPDGLQPAQMVLEIGWCLLARAEPAITDYPSLYAWLKSLRRPVRLGMPSDQGFLRLWLRAMEQKTHLPWEAFSYRHASDSMLALRANQVDLVTERCADIMPLVQPSGMQMQVLAYSGPLTSTLLNPDTPTFVQRQLPPVSLGWISWFVPAGMSEARQRVVGKALHAILLRPDTQQLIRSMSHMPMRWTPQESQERIFQAQKDWETMLQWLNWRDAR